MRTLYPVFVGLIVAGLLAGTALAETYELTDGQSLTGDIVSYNEAGLVVRLAEGKYGDRVPWTKFSQSDLKKLQQNPKIAPFVEPFIEVSQEEKVKKTEVEIKPVPRLERPQVNSLFGALFSSGVGLFAMFLLYAANIYAAYEVAVFRAQPRVMVCGLAAIPFLGLLAPLVFLALPTRIDRSAEPEVAPEVTAAAAHSFAVPGSVPDPGPGTDPRTGLRLSQAQGGHATSSLPTTQVFQRGAFTFNRRFFETKFPGFFAVVRRDADKDMVLSIKSPRGEWVAHRITRIAANDLHVNVQKGVVTEEVMIPFSEIQEIQLKHKDA